MTKSLTTVLRNNYTITLLIRILSKFFTSPKIYRREYSYDRIPHIIAKLMDTRGKSFKSQMFQSHCVPKEKSNLKLRRIEIRTPCQKGMLYIELKIKDFTCIGAIGVSVCVYSVPILK